MAYNLITSLALSNKSHLRRSLNSFKLIFRCSMFNLSYNLLKIPLPTCAKVNKIINYSVSILEIIVDCVADEMRTAIGVSKIKPRLSLWIQDFWMKIFVGKVWDFRKRKNDN